VASAAVPAVFHPSGLVRDPLEAIAVSAAPIVLEGRYRLLVGALFRLRRSRRGRWAFAAGWGAFAVVIAVLAARHFATQSWPLSNGQPGVLAAVGLLLLLAQAFKAYGWGRLFARAERPGPLALAAGNGGAAVIGLVLPGRFDDAMRVAVVRRYPGCPAGVRALCLSLVMLGLIDSIALAPLALAAAVFSGAGLAVRLGLGVVAFAGVLAAALILALPRLARSRRVLRFRLGRWLNPRTTSRRGSRRHGHWCPPAGLSGGSRSFCFWARSGWAFRCRLRCFFSVAARPRQRFQSGPRGRRPRPAPALRPWSRQV
jgi:hypothetical protein